jgi:hypothetical protein
MLATTTAVHHPVLVLRGDRRAPRSEYHSLVMIDGHPVTGRDISSTGISVLLRSTLEPGDVVRVTLSEASGAADEVGTRARVSRIEADPEGFVIGLQFIE